jgi:hypothetical protein
MRPIVCIQSSIQFKFFFVEQDLVRDNSRKAGKISMIAWETMATDDKISEEPAVPASASLIYRLTAAFPTWAGAMLAVYAIFSRFGVSMFDAFRFRPR